MDSMTHDDGCGRYALAAEPDELRDRYNLAAIPSKISVSYDMKPGQILPVVAVKDGERRLDMMRWGLVPGWSKDPNIGFKTFNARDDKVFASGMWRSIYKKRVLVPATGYFEWTKPARGSGAIKQKFYFRPKGIGIFSFAGFYDTWKDADGNEWPTYTLITTEPNKEARVIHDRMPVILRPEDEGEWIDPSKTKREELEPFLRPFEDNGLEAVEVSSDISAWPSDDPRLIANLISK